MYSYFTYSAKCEHFGVLYRKHQPQVAVLMWATIAEQETFYPYCVCDVGYTVGAGFNFGDQQQLHFGAPSLQASSLSSGGSALFLPLHVSALPLLQT